MAPESPLLASRGSHEECLDAFGGVLRQGAADAERLVVGVGEDGHQAKGRGGHTR